MRLQYDGRPFSPEGLSVTLKGQYGAYASVWHYGDNGRNLKGTARTLDEADGAIPLGDGLMSWEGYAVLDDSRTMRMDGEGNLLPAEAHGIDLYLFAYGRDFKARSGTSIISPARRRRCRATPWATGGAASIPTPRRPTRP